MGDPLMTQGVEQLIARLGAGIECTPDVCGGEPRIAGTRIPVWTLEQARRLGTTEADLLRDFPGLRAADLVNAWSYVAVHRAEIEEQIGANEEALRLAAFSADENFREPVVEALRRLGHDVLTCREAGRAGQGVADEDVLSDALTLGRAVLTQNRRHFIRLDRAGRDHCGIVVCTYDPDAEGLARRIDAAVAGHETGGRWLVRVNRPHPAVAP